MNDFNFVYYSLKSRLLNSSLSIILTAFGVSIALLILQFENHINQRLNVDGKGIDIVIGARGSPLQLVLSSIYHIDIPTGNISFKSIEKYMKHPQIEKAIPIALGDNWKGHRIVGTTKDYIDHYGTKIKNGHFWRNDFEILIGSSINLKINDEILGSHGLLKGGNQHADRKYKVVGIMEPTGTVMDRLIITSLNSVLKIHGLEDIHNENTHDHDHEYKKNDHNHDDNKISNEEKNHKHHEHHENDQHHNKQEANLDNSFNLHKEEKAKINKFNSPKITALLLTTRTPIANANLPRLINKETNLQAANPAIEITRLVSMFGLGSKSIGILSTILICIAILSIFSGLASNLENRLTDLAILRALGYSKKRIFKIIIFEGMTIVIFGLFVGILIAIQAFRILTEVITPLNISLASFNYSYDFFMIIITVIVIGLGASIFPAYQGSKISVANQLNRNT